MKGIGQVGIAALRIGLPALRRVAPRDQRGATIRIGHYSKVAATTGGPAGRSNLTALAKGWRFHGLDLVAVVGCVLQEWETGKVTVKIPDWSRQSTSPADSRASCPLQDCHATLAPS
jgi:hypothetical protein